MIELIESWSDFNGEFDNLLESYTCFDFVRTRCANSILNHGGVQENVRSEFTLNNLITRICKHFIDCVVLYMKCSVFEDMQDVIAYIAYVSPELSNIYNRREYKNGIIYIDNNILELKSAYPDAYFYLAGDFNARTSNMFIPDDNINNIFQTDVDYNNDNFDMHRNNRDGERSYALGQSLIELCCTYGVHILNGRDYMMILLVMLHV